MGSTLFGNDHLEIFAGDDQHASRGNVESLSGIVTPVRLPPGRFMHTRKARSSSARPLLRRRKRKSALPGEPGTHGAWRRTGLAVTIIEGILVDEAEDVSAFLVRSHHELTVRRESAPELLVLIAGRV